MMLYRTNPGRSVGVWTAASDIVSQAPRKSEEDEEGFSRCVSDHCIHEVLYPEIVTSPRFLLWTDLSLLESTVSDLAAETLLHRRRSKGKEREQEGERERESSKRERERERKKEEGKKRNHGRPNFVCVVWCVCVRHCDSSSRIYPGRGGGSINWQSKRKNFHNVDRHNFSSAKQLSARRTGIVCSVLDIADTFF